MNTSVHAAKSFFCAACVVLALAGCERSQDASTTAEDAGAETSSQSETTERQAAERRAVVAETLAYAEVDDQLVKGHFVFPEDMVEPLPALILIHEWWGLDKNTRGLADRLASESFIVLAIDLFGGRTAASPNDARALMKEVVENPKFAEQNIRQAAEWILSTTGATEVATIGYEFGGSWSLNAAISLGADLDAAVIYYGQVLGSETTLSTIEAPILAFFAGTDTMVPSESITAFESAMNNLGKDVIVETIPGAKRGFASPGHRNYQATLAQRKWEQMIGFLNDHMSPVAD